MERVPRFIRASHDVCKSRPPADEKCGAVGEHPSVSSATEIRAHLSRLELERFAAKCVGLETCRTYMSDLEAEIAHMRSAYAGAAVTEIAVLRGELSGRHQG